MVSLTLITDNASRPGRRFEPGIERTLYGHAAASVASLALTHESAVVVREMTGPIGVPDFVVWLGAPGDLERRVQSALDPILSRLDSEVLGALWLKRPISVEVLMQRVGMGSAATRQRIRSLVSSGHILSSVSGGLTLNQELAPFGRLIAVEAKIDDWRGAVYQARRYRTWAENYVVVTNSLGVKPTLAAKDVVAGDGGGLVSDGEWRARPRRRRLNPSMRFLGLEHFAHALRSGVSTVLSGDEFLDSFRERVDPRSGEIAAADD